MKPKVNPEALRLRLEAQLEAGPAAQPTAESPRPCIPDHKLLVRIGAGSYGDVWLAQGVTGSFYAVKVVWRHKFSSQRPYEREFSGIACFEPISRSHPGVVNVLHVGRDDALGCFFYVMELADPIVEPAQGFDPAGYVPHTVGAELKKRGRLPVAEVLSLGVQLADALAHLHRHGLVHRDVKPSNVIFVKGQAKLADIGLVIGTDEARSFVGTEGFIPPEGPGTMQADVFALGRLLYVAATGKDRCDFPDLPADLDRWPDREAMLELNEILTRACAPEPAQRHQTAGALMADLSLLLSGRSIRRAYGIEQRLRRVTLTAAVAGLMACVTAGAVWFQHRQRARADAQAARETTLRQRAEQSERLSRQRLRESLLREALALSTSSLPERRERALAALRSAAAIRPGTDLRDAAIAALATPELRVLRRWNARSDHTLTARPDVNLTRYFRSEENGTVRILRITDDQELLRLPSVGPPAEFGQFSPDGGWLALKYTDASLRAWDLSARTNMLITRQAARGCLAFDPAGTAVVVAMENGQVRLVDLPTGTVRWQRDQKGEPFWLAVHPALPLVAVAFENRICFFNTTHGELLRVAPVPTSGLVGLWTDDGRQLLTTHADYSIRAWAGPRWEAPQVIMRFHLSEPSYLAVDPSGRWLASAGWDNQVFWSSLSDGRVLLSLTGDSVASAHDRPTYLWSRRNEWTLAELQSAFVPETIPVHEQEKSPQRVAFSPDGRWIATAGYDGIRLLETRGRKISVLLADGAVKALGFGADAHSLRAMTEREMLRFELELAPRPGPARWRLVERKQLPGALDARVAEFSPDGRAWIGLGTRDGQPESWFIGQVDHEDCSAYRFPTPEIEFPALSPNGRWLAWGNWRGNNAYVVDLQAAKQQPLLLHSEGSTTVLFSPDGQWLVVSDTVKLQLFEAGSFHLLRSVARTSPGVLPGFLAFTPDSKLLASTLPPNQVQLTDPATGATLATLQTPERHFLSRLCFSPDGQVLAVASQDHALLLWDLTRLRGKLRELGLDW